MKFLETKGSKVNDFFSAFLVIAYIICAYFFSTLADQQGGSEGNLIKAIIAVVFGLLLFYATRVGEGKQVRRFSPAALVLIDIPALYIILAAFNENMPLSSAINPEFADKAQTVTSGPSVILLFACVALGYGLPYTFLSGYQLDTGEVEEEEAAETVMIEGGIMEELAAAEAAEAAETFVSAEETVTEPADEEKPEAADAEEEKKEEE